MEEQEILKGEESLFQKGMQGLKRELPYKKVFLVALVATFVFGICAHGFAFFNLNVSHDALYEFYNEVSARQKFGIGRFIEPFFRFTTGEAYVLPWFAGVIGLSLIACGVYLICKMFALNSVWQVVLLSGVFSVNVTVTSLISSFLHDFSGDMLAFFLSVWVAYVWVQNRTNKKKSAPVLMGLGAFAVLGIYQAYISVTVTLMLTYSLLAFLRGEDWKTVFKRVLIGALSLAAAGIAYALGSLLFEKLWGQALSDYNGMGALLVSPLRYLLRIAKAYGRTFVILFVPDCGKMSTTYSMLAIKGFCVGNWLICILNALLFLYTAYCCGAGLRRKKLPKGNLICVILVLVLLPLSMNLAVALIEICHDVMKMGAWLFYLIVVLLLRWYGETVEREENGKKRNHAFIVFPLTLFVLFNGIGVSNTCYVKKELDAQATLSSVTRLISEIEEQDGYVYGETEVAILGNFDTIHNNLRLFELDGKELFVAGVDYNASVSYLATWKAYFDIVVRYSVNLSDYEKVDSLKKTDVVKNMPIYPQEGSICTVDGVIVVKLSYED
ncbi:MAG: glucosyltransferase domain-containing protein [Clostridia bacterium]|nr:glucosyltransferase domain-containing protein [Clostridia bacterium]